MKKNILLAVALCIFLNTFAQTESCGYAGHVFDEPVVVIDKEKMRLFVVDGEGEEVVSYPIACGSGLGNKQKSGDKRTPEGEFSISQIVDASA